MEVQWFKWLPVSPLLKLLWSSLKTFFAIPPPPPLKSHHSLFTQKRVPYVQPVVFFFFNFGLSKNYFHFGLSKNNFQFTFQFVCQQFLWPYFFNCLLSLWFASSPWKITSIYEFKFKNLVRLLWYLHLVNLWSCSRVSAKSTG